LLSHSAIAVPPAGPTLLLLRCQIELRSALERRRPQTLHCPDPTEIARDLVAFALGVLLTKRRLVQLPSIVCYSKEGGRFSLEVEVGQCREPAQGVAQHSRSSRAQDVEPATRGRRQRIRTDEAPVRSW
jgi:hypothetical protein